MFFGLEIAVFSCLILFGLCEDTFSLKMQLDRSGNDLIVESANKDPCVGRMSTPTHELLLILNTSYYLRGEYFFNMVGYIILPFSWYKVHK